MPFNKIPKKAEAGLIRLTAAEIAQNLKTKIPDDCVTCGRQIFIGMFFDGTGNNKDTKPNELTNVAHLYEAYLKEPADKYFKHYIEGVGTPCTDAGDEKDGDGLGGAFGNMGQERIILGLIHILNTIKIATIGGELIPKNDISNLCKQLGGENKTTPAVPTITPQLIQTAVSETTPARDVVIPPMKEYVKKLQGEIEGKSPKLTQINLSVFGFSRGAAAARSFCNWLENLCENQTLAGIKVQIDFLGIFDTVASVGLTDTFNLNSMMYFMSGHNRWADPEYLKISNSGFVKKCVHYVAGHEARACFPLDSIRVGSSYAAHCHETVYMGSHSDVGGGYADGALGIWEPHLARISGQHMYQEAFISGAPLVKPANLSDDTKKGLTIDKKAATVFNRYVERMKSFTGDSVESQLYGYWKNYLMQRAVSASFEKISSTGGKLNDPLVDITQQEIYSYLALYIAKELTSIRVSVESTAINKPEYVIDLKNTHLLINVNEGLNVLLDLYSTWTSLFLGRKPQHIPEFESEYYPPSTSNSMYHRDQKGHFYLDDDFQSMALEYIHDSQAGFISMLTGAEENGESSAESGILNKIKDYAKKGLKKTQGFVLSEGEFSLNLQGIMKHRRIYAGGFKPIDYLEHIPKYTATGAHHRVVSALQIHKTSGVKFESESDILWYLLDLLTPPIKYTVAAPTVSKPMPEWTGGVSYEWGGSFGGGDAGGGGANGSY